MRAPSWITTGILALQGVALAAGTAPRLEKQPLEIEVTPGIWNAQDADVKAVVSSAANEIWKNVAYGQMPRIILVRPPNPKYPVAVFEHDAQDRMQIQVTTTGRLWCQYMYQFAHEFCHGMSGHSLPYERQWKNRSGENFWLEESLCEMASWFAMRSAAKTWATNPPYPNWKSYAANIQDYVDKDMARHRLPEGQSFVDWLNEHQIDMRSQPTIRGLNALVAKQLLPLFEAEPAAWEVMLYRGRAKGVPGETLQQHLQAWHDQCPADLQPFMRKVMEVFKGASEKVVVTESPVSKEFELDLQDGAAWGNANPVDVKAVLMSAGKTLWASCTGHELRRVLVTSGGPATDNERDPRNRIVVKLAARDRFWCQYSYQFGHELGHILLGHVEPYEKQWKHASPTQAWFEESLCEAAAIFTLQGMARDWQTAPPYPHWASYSKSIQEYVDGITRNPAKSLPAGQDLPAWIAANLATLKATPQDRVLNGMVANQLVPLFTENPAGWSAVTYLRRSAPAADETLEGLFQRWHKNSPDTLKEFVEKLGAKLGVKAKTI